MIGVQAKAPSSLNNLQLGGRKPAPAPRFTRDAHRTYAPDHDDAIDRARNRVRMSVGPPRVIGWRAVAWQWLLLFGVALAVRGSFLLEPPGRDQGLFWTQAELLLGGARLYDQVWEHKPPGILALYAGARALSSSYVVVHLLNGFAVLATALMLHALCRRRGLSDASALFGALSYLLFAAGPAFGGYWMIAQPEVFLDPLLCAALLLTGAASLSSALFAGIAIGSTIFAIKYSALPLVLIALLQPARIGTGPRAHAGKLVFALGSALPLVALLAYFAVTGRAQAWFDITVLFNLEHARVGRVAFWSDPLAFAFPLSLSLLVFYVFALLAIICRLLRGKRHPVADDGLLYLGAALWILALVQVALQGKSGAITTMCCCCRFRSSRQSASNARAR